MLSECGLGSWSIVFLPYGGVGGGFSDRNTVDLDFGKLLAVAVFLAIALAAFLFENDHFITLYVAQYDALDERAAHVGDANGEITVILNEMHGVERDSIPFLSCQPVDEDLLTFLNFKLLTGDGNDCEHIDSQKIGEKNTPFRKGRAKVLRRLGKTKPLFC